MAEKEKENYLEKVQDNSKLIQETEESIFGYTEQLDLMLREVKANERALEFLPDKLKRLEPQFEYQKHDEYWDIEAETFKIDKNKKLVELRRIITTIEDALVMALARLERFEEDKK